MSAPSEGTNAPADPGEPSKTAAASLTFVGTATTILRLGRFTILTDPNFLRRGQRAYLGKGLWSRRLTEPAIGVDELPALSAIVLSHLHGDHFDRVARAGLDRTPPVITTVAAGQRLRRYGFITHGLENWQRHTLTQGDEELSIESLPAVHARGLMGRLLPPVMGSLLEHRAGGRVVRRVMLSGDTLTGAHLDTIHERHPDIDAAIVHLGGTRVLWHTVTMDGQQGVDYLRRIDPKRAVPVHYDDYGVFRSPLSDFLDAAGAAGLEAVVQPVRRGDQSCSEQWTVAGAGRRPRPPATTGWLRVVDPSRLCADAVMVGSRVGGGRVALGERAWAQALEY